MKARATRRRKLGFDFAIWVSKLEGDDDEDDDDDDVLGAAMQF